MIHILAAKIQECASVAVPIATESAMHYYHIGNLLWTLQLVLSFLIPILFLISGFSGKLANFSNNLGKFWFLALAIYLIIFIGIYQLLSLPLDYYSEYLIKHDYHLSTQTLEKWFSNYGKWTLVYMSGAVAFVWIFYFLIKTSPRKWWLYSAIVSIGITFFITFITPIWVDPIFNPIGPMKNKKLEKKLLTLAAKGGIQADRIYEIEKSGETSMINAYVTGIWGTERIVIWDTAANTKNEEGLMFIVGHEMGHYVLSHNGWFMLYFSILNFIIFYLVYKTANFLTRKYHKRFGFNQLYNIASLPLLLLLITFFSFLASPLSNYVSRKMERDADKFGLDLTHNNYAAGSMFAELAKANLSNPNPGPIYIFFRGTHPSLKERIEFCNTYCPWKNQPKK